MRIPSLKCAVAARAFLRSRWNNFRVREALRRMAAYSSHGNTSSFRLTTAEGRRVRGQRGGSAHSAIHTSNWITEDTPLRRNLLDCKEKSLTEGGPA